MEVSELAGSTAASTSGTVHGAPTYTKLEWLVHRILSFTLRARATLRRIHQLPTSVGLAQARPNKD